MKKLLALFTFAFCILNAQADDTVQLRISTGFQKQIKQISAPLQKGDSVMDVLRHNAKLRTSYGGAFVNQIDSIPEDIENKDQSWFFYVNGLLSDKGALVYYPSAGESVWWDFHGWSEKGDITAVVGAFPEPFIHGFGGNAPTTKVVSTTTFASQAEQLASKLRAAGAKNVNVAGLDQLAKELGTEYGIVIGEWSAIKDLPLIQSALADAEKSNVHLRVQDENIAIQNLNGEQAQQVKGGGFIIALNSSAQVGPTWLVSGTDQKNTTLALETLLSHADKLQFLPGAIVHEDEVIAVPVLKAAEK